MISTCVSQYNRMKIIKHSLVIIFCKPTLRKPYYIHFRANTLGKGMNPLILPPAMGK